jgi:hypothetical protein
MFSAIRFRPPLVESLEIRRFLSVTLETNYAGTITLPKSNAAIISTGSRQLSFALTVTAQNPDGQISGDLSAGQFGTFAFTGSQSGKSIQLVFEGETGGAGMLTANLTRNGSALNGKFTSKIDGQKIAGTLRATAGGQAVSADGVPSVLGQSAADTTASGSFAHTFNGTAQVPRAATSGNSSTSTTSSTTTAGSMGAITGAAGAIPIANSTSAITGSTGSITGSAGAITGSIGSPITGATGAVTGSIGMPVMGATGAITGSTGAITGAIGALNGAVTGATGAINGGAGATPIGGANGAITGAIGAITGAVNSATGMGSIFGLASNPPSLPATTQPQALLLSIATESTDGLITGTFTLANTVFNFDAFITGNTFTMILAGPASGHAQGTLSANRSVFNGTFAVPGSSPSSGSFTTRNSAASA